MNHYLGDKWQAFSAGVRPTRVNNRARLVMAEIGIDISSAYSKSVEDFLNRDDLDLIITVCDNARETCPVFPRQIKQIHIGFEDPAPYSNLPDEAALPKFREIRDKIKNQLLARLNAEF